MRVHGGPHFLDMDRWAPDIQAHVDAGFLVAMVNYRGSVGFGQAWRDELTGNIGFVELEDVLAGLDDLVARGVADPARAVLAGWSWGGYVTLLGLGRHPDRWISGIGGVPVADYVAAYEDEAPILQALDRALFGGSPETAPDLFRERNPITYADAVRAPVLIMAGENDSRCPIRQVWNYVDRLRSGGVAARGLHVLDGPRVVRRRGTGPADGDRARLPGAHRAGHRTARGARRAPCRRGVRGRGSDRLVDREVVGALVAAGALLARAASGTSLSRLLAPNRNRSGVIQRGPSVSYSTTRYWIASLAVRMPPAGFMPTTRPVRRWKSRIASSMTSVTGSVAAGVTLPVEVLMKSAPAAMARMLRAAHVVERLELARLEDDLEVGVAAGGLDRHDLVEHGRVVARQEGATVDDHVDLVGAGLDRRARLGELDVGERLARGKAVGHAGDLDARPARASFASATNVRDRRRSRRPSGMDGSPGSGRMALAQSARTLPGVSFPSRVVEVHHPDGQLERPDLGRLLDRALRQRVDALADADLVDRVTRPRRSRGSRPAADQAPDSAPGLVRGWRVRATDVSWAARLPPINGPGERAASGIRGRGGCAGRGGAGELPSADEVVLGTSRAPGQVLRSPEWGPARVSSCVRRHAHEPDRAA